MRGIDYISLAVRVRTRTGFQYDTRTNWRIGHVCMIRLGRLHILSYSHGMKFLIVDQTRGCFVLKVAAVRS